MEILEYIEKTLFEMQDLQYRDFNSKLIPSVDKNKIIGVRTPELRKLAKETAFCKDTDAFLSAVPHKYFEENQLHAFIISSFKNCDSVFEELERFLPFVDNWATCDQMNPKIFKKHLPELSDRIKIWIASGKTYTVRFGLNMLMTYFLDSEFKPEYLELAARVKSEEYYVNMMIAWFFATALAKQYSEAIIYIENHKLDGWVHNKTIQKAVESYRISAEQKTYLKKLKITKKDVR